MARYVALLRGINLGSSRRVAMADLRAWLTDLGYADVRTHLQSGNAVLASDKRIDAVGREIEERLAEETGFPVDCVMRTAGEMRAVVDGDPFGEVASNGSRYMVSFLAGPVDRERLPDLDPAAYEPELLHVGEREIYFWCPDGVQDSKLLKLFSGRTGPMGTVRNWNTVTKLAVLAAD